MLFVVLAAALGPGGWLVVVGGLIGAAVPSLALLGDGFGSLGMGNLEVLVALIAVIGLRYPATWVAVLASKVTPGLGLIWFVAGREWRPLAIALGVTSLAIAFSVALAPGLWPDWFSLLAERSVVPFPLVTVPVPLAARVATGAALVWWGARRDARWTLPLAMGRAIPGGYISMWMIWLAAVPRVRRRSLTRWRPMSEPCPSRTSGPSRYCHSRGRQVGVISPDDPVAPSVTAAVADAVSGRRSAVRSDISM